MKVVILAGGLGTRISEETTVIPKPMIEIGGKPILWHIMKGYSFYGFNDFVLCLGYKGNVIREYFANYYLHQCDVTFDFMNGNERTIHSRQVEPWKVTLVDTGVNTMTGGRLKKAKKHIGNETFMMTYGDGVSNVPFDRLAEYHKKHGKMATLTAIQPAGRFGSIDFGPEGQVCSFMEKPPGDGSWISGGFFVLEPGVFDLIDGDDTIWEREPLERLAQSGQLRAYRHGDCWHCLDTLRDKLSLEKMWESGQAKWKMWS